MVAWRLRLDPLHEVESVGDLYPVDRDEAIARLQTGALGGTTGHDLHDLEVKAPGRQTDTQIRAPRTHETTGRVRSILSEPSLTGDPDNHAGGPANPRADDAERWGELPQRLREVFRNQGGDELPVQYRDWIDAYYRRLNTRR